MNSTGNPHSARMEQSGILIPTGSKTALKLLNSLAFDQLRAKHPDIRPEWLPRPGYKDKTANQLTQSIIAWIRLQGQQAERIAVTGRPIDRTRTVIDCMGNQRLIGSVTWIPGTVTKGSADISAIVKGKTLKIEVKIGSDRQSNDQKKYQQNIEKAGGLYFIATSFEQFYKWYKSTFK